MKKIFQTILLFFLIPLSIKATTKPLDVVINEIAWMGTKANSADEWIELYNSTNQDINLEGWGLYEGETLIEPLTGIIKANSYYLIERTDDNTVKSIEASQEPSSWGGYGLNNNGEDIFLSNKDSIIDEVNCSEGWFAGDSDNYKTMERINTKEIGSDPNNWQTNYLTSGAIDYKNNLINGTPKSENSKKSKDQEEESLESKPIEKTYSSQIIINEILPSPEGPDSENEWIELKNVGSQEVSLISWKITDKKGGTNTYTFPEESIKPNSFFVLYRPTSKITLNNTGDCVDLIQPDNNILDSVCYNNAPLGKSYSFIDSEWSWTDQLSPNAMNLIEKEKNNQKKEIEEKESNQNKEPIEIKKIQDEKQIEITNNSFFFIFFIAILTSLLFSFSFLKLKKKVKEKFDFQKKIS